MVSPASSLEPTIDRAAGSRLVSLAVIGVGIAALSYGEGLLKPLAFAALLCFMVTPVVRRLERLHIPRGLSIAIVVSITFVLLGLLGWLVTAQVRELGSNLPTYKVTLIERIRTLRGITEKSFTKVSDALGELRSEIISDEQIGSEKPPSAAVPAESSGSDPSKPILWKQLTQQSNNSAPTGGRLDPLAVKVVAPTGTLLGQLQNVLGPLLSPLTTAGIVMVLLIFMLIQREDLRNRIIAVVGTPHLNATTQALDDTTQRLGRYLRMQLLVNSLYGVAVALGLFMIGLPGSVLWGLLATLLRFLPYIGPWIAATIPVLISFAVFNDWGHPILTISVFVVLELVSNNVLEPWLYGASIGVSSMGVIISAIFWTWLWGPVGLIFAMPFTVCLIVLGKHLPGLSAISILLGEATVLSTAERVYQRFLALDSDECDTIVSNFVRTNDEVALADEVLIPALSLAEFDRHQGRLEKRQEEFIVQTTSEIITEFIPSVSHEKGTNDGDCDLQRSVLCVPAHDAADEITAQLLAAILRRTGMSVDCTTRASLASELIERIGATRYDAVVIASLPPQAVHFAKYLCKRLSSVFPALPIIVGAWNESLPDSTQSRLLEGGATKVVATIREAQQAVCAVPLRATSLSGETVTNPIRSNSLRPGLACRPPMAK